jgi:hypothetical protein
MEFLSVLVVVFFGISIKAYGAINQISWREISNINNKGPYIGIVVPNAYELKPLLQSSSFVPHTKFPYFNFAGNFYIICFQLFYYTFIHNHICMMPSSSASYFVEFGSHIVTANFFI